MSVSLVRESANDEIDLKLKGENQMKATRILLIAIATASVHATTSLASNWKDLEQGKDSKVQIDTQSVRHTKTGGQAWVRMVKGDHRDLMELFKINCGMNTYTPIQAISYNSDGSVFRSEDSRSPQPVVPDSRSELVSTYICKKSN